MKEFAGLGPEALCKSSIFWALSLSSREGDLLPLFLLHQNSQASRNVCNEALSEGRRLTLLCIGVLHSPSLPHTLGSQRLPKEQWVFKLFSAGCSPSLFRWTLHGWRV